MYTEEMKTALKEAQHILESAGLTTEGFDDEFGVDDEYRVCISNQLDRSGEAPPFTKPKIVKIYICQDLYSHGRSYKVEGLPVGYEAKIIYLN